MTRAPVLSLQDVSRRFNGVPAVDRVSLEIGAGEFFTLVGPSGSGKTTTLRLIAGFEDPDAGGTIRMQGEVVNGKRPYQRPIGMVFQSYALFPHLTVAGNISFGLEERRLPRSDIRLRVARALELVRLDPSMYASRRPAELSGGQRQRVALARALVLQPRVLLLDEPLAALDPQLRVAMRLELRELNRTLGITFVLVTHDQEEALAMSDRIAVMSAGRVEQVGPPVELYRHPRTAFVARFIGEANIFHGVVQSASADTASVMQPDGRTWRIPGASRLAPGTTVEVAVRPEWHRLVSDETGPAGDNVLPGRIREISFQGERSLAVVALQHGGEARVVIRHGGAADERWRPGDRIGVAWRPEDSQVLE